MIVIGGLDPTEAEVDLSQAFNGTAGPWAQGLGVFDMTSLQWKSRYEANAATYVPADIVKQYAGSEK